MRTRPSMGECQDPVGPRSRRLSLNWPLPLTALFPCAHPGRLQLAAPPLKRGWELCRDGAEEQGGRYLPRERSLSPAAEGVSGQYRQFASPLPAAAILVPERAARQTTTAKAGQSSAERLCLIQREANLAPSTERLDCQVLA